MDKVDTIKNKQKMIEAMEQCRCIVSDACKAVGIARQTHYNWMADDPDYANSITSLNDTAVDWVESKLYDLIRLGDTTATIFYLKTKGRKRGFNERLELSHETPEGLDIKVEFIKPENT